MNSLNLQAIDSLVTDLLKWSLYHLITHEGAIKQRNEIKPMFCLIRIFVKYIALENCN